MTAAQLLTWIVSALLLQVALGSAVALWRRRAVSAAARTDLAQATPPPSLAAWPGTRDFRVVSRTFEDPARTQCSFVLAPVDGAALPDFKPGQFLTFALSVPDPAAPGGRRSVVRCYSLSDRPMPSHFRVTIKRVPAPADRPDLPPGVSSNHFHDRVREGDLLQIKAPSGHFHIDPDATVPAVLVAGGIGITPMMSMLQWCLAEQPQRRLHLYYGVRHGGEHAFKQALQAIAAAHPLLTLHIVYSRPAAGDRPGVDFQHAGHVDRALLQRTLPPGRHQFYLCGPAALMETLVPALAAWGVPDADLHFEAFGPASVRKPGAPAVALATPVAVRFQRAGRTLVWEGGDGNLLDFAERHGVVVDSGCRSGGCGSCETRLLEGSVAYDQAPDHDLAPGCCLLCVGRPASALVLEA